MIGWKPGELIDTPGIYPTIPIAEYHGQLTVDHSVSHTGLDRIFKGSPLHYFDKWYGNPDREADDPTEAMILGKAAHHLFLGERDFQKHYIRRPAKAPDGREWHGLNGSCKAWLETQAKKRLTVLKPEQIDKLSRMKVALDREPMIKAGLLGGRVETSFVWQDQETDIWLKARPDTVPNESGDFADLKCVSAVTDDALEKIIGDFGYHRQAALVLEGAHHLLGYPLKFRGPGEAGMSFTLVFVESSRPHCVEIITLKPSDLDRGMYENRMALRLLKRCLDTGEWPGPSGGQKDARYLGMKSYAIDRDIYRAHQIQGMLAIAEDRITEQA